ncbi:MAG: hypothetical protein R2844_12025 [Caldilineales bacterium]
MRLASTLRELGDLMTLTGKPAARSRLFRREPGDRRNLDDRRGVWLVLSGVAKLMLASGAWSECVQLCGGILDAGQRMGLVMPPEERRALEIDLSQLRQQLDEAGLAAAWAAGQQLSLDQAAGHAQSWLARAAGVLQPDDTPREIAVS